MRDLLTAFCLAVLAGCAGTPDTGSTSREYVEQDRANRFADFSRECSRRNGIVVMSGSASRIRRNGTPRRILGYYCQRRQVLGPGLSF